jgi:two-component system phosphate regulon response regulator PhoB
MTGASPKRLLLVEDDRFLRRACEVSLRQRGFAVTTAANGEEALRLAREALPDLVLLDQILPGMTGLEVLRQLRAAGETQAIRVLVLSNSSREQDIAEFLSLGVVDYLVKADLSLQELGDRVARLVGA